MTLVLENEEKRKLYCECSQSHRVWSKIHARTLVISRARRNGTELMSTNRMENGIKRHDAQLCRMWTSYICATGALERGELKSKGKGWTSIHFNGSDETIEFIPRTGISVNQLSVYGAVADLCGELAGDSRGTGKPAANEDLKSMLIPTEFPTAKPVSQADAEVQGNLLREYEQKFAELPEKKKYWPDSAPMLVFRRILRKDYFSLHLMMIDLTI